MILAFCNTDSLGEQIQKAFPWTRVVKALNTVNCEIMIEPSRVAGDHNLFICGNDAAAKKDVTGYLVEWFGWNQGQIIDLGDITAARLSVCNQFAEEELVRGEIEDEETRLRRRQRVIDDRQQVAFRDEPAVLGARGGGESQLEHGRPQTGSLRHERGDLSIG